MQNIITISLFSKNLSQMLYCHFHSHILSPLIFPLSLQHHRRRRRRNAAISRHFLHKPNTVFSLSALPPTAHQSWLTAQLPDLTAQLPDLTTAPSAAPDEGGPLELPPSSSSIFATTDEPSPIQLATSVLLTGAISVFLFRALRRRAKRAKELKFRSSGAKKTLKEEALDSLKAMGSGPIDANKPSSPVQAFLGGISAGIIALILYKFTTTIEAALNRQTLSDSYSARQMTIAIRTIVNGLCYLATFVFGANSVGLFLYSAQLAFSSFTEDLTDGKNESKGTEQPSSPNSTSEDPPAGSKFDGSLGDQNSDN